MFQSLLSETQKALAAFRQPRIEDEARAARAVWEQLPNDLRVDDQVLGRHSAGCAATYGVMEACDFYCTACYLSDEANHTPPLPWDEVKAQLDRIRQHLGPWGNTQITAGEVTLLPRDDLVRIIKYCYEIELAPMLMTNGQNILKDPSYLEQLVLEGGLDKIAIHIDTTEKGRLGLKKTDTEKDIHWIRDAFANLLRQTRKRTEKPLAASQTFTVTEKNLEDIPDVMQWCIRNVDAFRMISFQPTADVGRTRSKEQVGRREIVWEQICKGLGQHINGNALKFGHPDCNTVAMMFVVSWQDANGEDRFRLMEVTRDDPRDKQFFLQLLNDFAGFSPDGEAPHIVLSRIFGRIAKKPRFIYDIPAYCIERAMGEREWVPEFAKAVAAGRRFQVKPFVVVVHNFMSAHELETEVGQERVASCAFRVPIDGEMISMCELNARMRDDLNKRDQERLVSLGSARRRKSA